MQQWLAISASRERMWIEELIPMLGKQAEQAQGSQKPKKPQAGQRAAPGP
ncbi:hypothetical protein LN426_12290 [Pseudomonas syringae]|nr:hypothetical protein [Pseudomonas syringae]MCK9766541.1 hypothetical protein [Pseudomonas syringae pv. syringae]MCK9775718.1 hypothetical protein [Pseudomonas syringae pv. syringae]MDC6495114.1 hypothetical protein [Pseudomonas syringae]MDC6525848.1 hypothetical protein [Pseudomonas syringae]MDC6536395.1 hypothetical protein [Pseudomonas syringae]